MLKSLELTGFKSFADRTVFDFSTGITAVVGPNGSGKSNVVDGIKWILGDQSAKSLRGKEMTDVIFNGASGRKSANYAEATLKFDNRSRFLPRDEDQISIGRRLLRSGDAEYLINGQTARLRDVRELLSGTGAGASAYAIIEQGRVDQILQSNATARRAVFEEAAGISKFKSRKNEAIRKLERVEQNLLRLTDIVDEVESQRNSLRSQASKADKYRKLSAELKELWLGLAADDSRRLNDAVQKIEQTIAKQAQQIDELNSQLQELELELKQSDANLASIDEGLRRVEKIRSENREEIARHQVAVRHNLSRQGELETELVRQRKQRMLLIWRAQEVVDELSHNQKIFEQSDLELRKFQENLEQGNLKKQNFVSKISADRETISNYQQQMMATVQQVSDAGNSVTALQSQLEEQESSKQMFAGQLNKLQSHLEHLNSQIEECKSRCQHAVTEVKSADHRVQEIQQELSEIQGEKQEGQYTIAEMREQRSASRARKSLLEDLELRREGMGVGVREILNRAKSSHQAPWNEIEGTVADLMNVDLEQAALLEVALGIRAELIVIKKFDSLIEYLNSGTLQISGRVQFIESQRESRELLLDEKAQQQWHANIANTPDLSDCPGVIQRADRLVESCELLPELPARLLADTWIVETLSDARSLSQADGAGCRFVTLQGELLESDGTLTVGFEQTESALVSRKSELRQLRNYLTELDSRIEIEEKRIKELSDSLDMTDHALGEAESFMQQKIEVLQSIESELESFQQQKRSLASEQAEVVAARNRNLREIEETHHGMGDARKKLKNLEEQLLHLESSIKNTEREIVEQEHALQQLEAQQQTDQLSYAKREERVRSLKQAFERLQQDQNQRLEQSNEAIHRYKSTLDKHREINLLLLNSNGMLAEFALVEESLSKQVLEQQKQINALRSERQVTIKQEADFRNARRKLNELQHAEKLKIKDIEHDAKIVAERILEEYQLTLEEVVQSGASAYQLYLKEKYPEQFETDQTDASESNLMDKIPDAQGLIEQEERDRLGDSDDSLADPVEVNFPYRQVTFPQFEEVRDELEQRVTRLRRKIKSMGSVNSDSLDSLDELEQRFEHLNSQLQDLTEAKHSLEEIVRRINLESKRLFLETFNSIRGHFQELFRKLFGGGEGDIILEDAEDVLECGIDIVARPPGKELRSISLLSGGERTMTAVSMLLAIFKSKPSPFCILDECDAALDEANVDRYVNLLTEFKSSTQFIMITHRKPSMAEADVLYGVTMEQSGVSKRMNVCFDDVNEHGEFKTPGDDDQNHSHAA